MSEHEITVTGGSTVRLKTAGKYCKVDILVTAEEGGGGGDDQLDALIAGTITSLTSNAPKVAGYLCYYADALVSVSMPEATEIGEYAFYTCGSLDSVDFQKATKVGTRAFYGSKKLVSANFPSATSVGNSAFESCTKLADVQMPMCGSVGNSALSGTAVRVLDFNELTLIDAYAFAACQSLTALIVRSSKSRPTLSNTNAFYNTPIASGTGYIYVPAAMIDTYKTASNWSAFSAQFRALEDYTVDGTVTGALDESKI